MLSGSTPPPPTCRREVRHGYRYPLRRAGSQLYTNIVMRVYRTSDLYGMFRQWVVIIGHHCHSVGLASHWPCVTDNSVITTYGLMALEREMSTPPIPSRSVAQFTFTIMTTGHCESSLGSFDELQNSAQAAVDPQTKPPIMVENNNKQKS